MVYKAKLHNIHKALYEADIRFPTSKKAMSDVLRNVSFATGFDTNEMLSDFINSLEPDYFENASAFYNAIVSHDTKSAMLANGY